jgi:hypothetical protein
MTGSCIVNQNVEGTSFGERGAERAFDREAVGQVELNRMQSRLFRDSLRIAGCAPDFVTLSDK